MVPHLMLTRRRGPRILSLSLLAALGAAACGGIDTDYESVSGDVREPDTAPPSARAVPFEEFTDDVGTARRDADASVDPDRARLPGAVRPRASRRRRLLPAVGHFYAAGTKPTGGFDANVVSLIVSGRSLVAVTELVSPGPECGVTDALTSPHVLVKLDAQTGTAVDFRKKGRASHCGCTPPPSPCAAILCQAGTHCEEQPVECVAARAPRWAPACPTRRRSPVGGIAGIQCPGLGQCIAVPARTARRRRSCA